MVCSSALCQLDAPGRILEWVALPFSWGSSEPRIDSQFFTLRPFITLYLTRTYTRRPSDTSEEPKSKSRIHWGQKQGSLCAPASTPPRQLWLHPVVIFGLTDPFGNDSSALRISKPETLLLLSPLQQRAPVKTYLKYHLKKSKRVMLVLFRYLKNNAVAADIVVRLVPGGKGVMTAVIARKCCKMV